jgi:hypothetical protein
MKCTVYLHCGLVVITLVLLELGMLNLECVYIVNMYEYSV